MQHLRDFENSILTCIAFVPMDIFVSEIWDSLESCYSTSKTNNYIEQCLLLQLANTYYIIQYRQNVMGIARKTDTDIMF